MKRFTRVVTLFLAGYFVVSTRLLFGLGVAETTQMRIILSKDLLRWIGVGVFFVAYRQHLLAMFKQLRKPLIVLVILVVVSCVSSFALGVPIQEMIIGFKYDLYPLVVLMIAACVGRLVARGRSQETLERRARRMIKLIIGVIVLGVIRQIAKMLRPDFFLRIMGYGPFGNFVPGMKPPLYYLTGPSGLPRLSGLFAGPNVLGYFLVAFFSFVVVQLEHRRLPKRLTILLVTFYIAAIGRCLSRGALVGVAVQIVLLMWFVWRTSIRQLAVIVIGMSIMIGGMVKRIDSTKGLSNTEHSLSTNYAIQQVMQQPRGYGLGYAGPANHYKPVFVDDQKSPQSLLENIYLQRLLNLGVVGFGLILVFGWLLLQSPFKLLLAARRRVLEPNERLIVSLFLGLVGLLTVGFVLQVFIDSMVNYLFLGAFGLAL